MILKIRAYGSQDWWIYGEVRRIHHELVKKERIEEDYDLCLIAEDTKVDEFLRIILRFVNGDEFGILTDSIAYLCNDRGETIEKIVA